MKKKKSIKIPNDILLNDRQLSDQLNKTLTPVTLRLPQVSNLTLIDPVKTKKGGK